MMFKALFVLFGLLALVACRAQETDPLAAAAALQDATQGPTFIMVTGQIKDEMAIPIAGKIVSAELASGKAPIILVIDSYGGSIDAAGTIIDAILLCRNHEVYTLDIGQADSAAAWIFTYGSKRVMWPHATLLFHQGHVEIEGHPDEVMATLVHYHDLAMEYDAHAASVAKLSYSQFEDYIKNGWWLQAGPALASHFATDVGTLSFK